MRVAEVDQSARGEIVEALATRVGDSSRGQFSSFCELIFLEGYKAQLETRRDFLVLTPDSAREFNGLFEVRTGFQQFVPRVLARAALIQDVGLAFRIAQCLVELFRPAEFRRPPRLVLP